MITPRSHFRTKSICVRVNETDFARLAALAQAQAKPLGEWCRDQLLAIADSGDSIPRDQILLAELLALRTIVSNVVYQVASGEGFITREVMKDVLDHADAGKHQRAAELLRGTRSEGTTDERRNS